MKKKTVAILLVFLLVLVLGVGSTLPVSAAKRVNAYVEVGGVSSSLATNSTDASCSLTFDYGWDGLGVHAYYFYFTDESGNPIGSTFGYYPADGVAKTMHSEESIDDSNYPVIAASLVPGSSYYVTMVLYSTKYRVIGTVTGFGPCSSP